MRIRVLLKVVSLRRITSPAIFIAVLIIGSLHGSTRVFADSGVDGTSLGLPQHGDALGNGAVDLHTGFSDVSKTTSTNGSAADIVNLTQTTNNDSVPGYNAASGGLHDALASPGSVANDPELQTRLPADQPWSLSNPSTVDSARVAFSYSRKPADHSGKLGVDWSIIPGATLVLLALVGGAGLIWRRR